MNHQQSVAAICAELKRARKKWPKFPKDIIHAVNIMMEEAGESSRAANIHTIVVAPKLNVELPDNIIFIKVNPDL